MGEDISEVAGIEDNTGDKIARAGMTVALAHAILKIVGFVAAVIVGQYLGNRHYDAVYAFAFEGIILSLFLVGEEAIGPCFLPIFMREFDKKDEKSAWDFANTVLTIQGIILGLVTAFIMCFPDIVIHIATKWDEAKHPETFALAKESLVWLAPALIFLSLGSTTYMILNGYKKFFRAAFGDATSRIVLIVSIVVGGWIFGMGYKAVIFGLVLGAVGKLATHLSGLVAKVKFLRINLKLRNEVMKAFVLLLIPLVAGILFAKLRDLFNNVWILSSLDIEGLMKANSLGRKIPDAIVWLVPYALSIAMFPYMCEMVDRNDRRKLGEMITQTTRHMLAVFLPFAFLFCITAGNISELVFRGGKLTSEMRFWTAITMGTYVFLLPARAVEQVLIQAYFADRRMLAVTVMGILSSLLSMLIAYVGVKVLGATEAYALAVVAGGLVLGRFAKAIAFALYMKTKIPMFPFIETLWFLVRVIAVGFAVAVSAYYVMVGIDRVLATTSPFWAAVKLTCAGGAGAGVFVASTFILRIREPSEMVQWTLAKLRKRGGRLPQV